MTSFQWCGCAIEFEEGETVAAALLRADIRGIASAVAEGRLFCGIGACQCCLVRDQHGQVFEACLTPASAAMCLFPPYAVGGRNA